MATTKKLLEKSWLWEMFDESYEQAIRQKADDEYQYYEYLKTKTQDDKHQEVQPTENY
jgi:hypothetical protein